MEVMTYSPETERRDPRRSARGLGALSLGLGAAQLIAPKAVRRISGVGDSRISRVMVPLGGVRELAHAAGLLAGRRTAQWAWTRVAGDAVDLAALGVAMFRGVGPQRRRVAGVTGAILAITAMDVVTAARATWMGPVRLKGGPMELTGTVTVRKSPPEVYAFWRRLENLPRFMAHLEAVSLTGERTSRWVATAPFGRNVEWDAEIVTDVPGERISWRSSEDAMVPNMGAVMFTPAPDAESTEVHVVMVYDVPGSDLGQKVAKFFGESPDQQIEDDLRRFKQVMETGEVVRSDGAPSGKRAHHEFPQRPAQPLPAEEREGVQRRESERVGRP
jgi:uncharacterized membrane protein